MCDCVTEYTDRLQRPSRKKVAERTYIPVNLSRHCVYEPNRRQPWNGRPHKLIGKMSECWRTDDGKTLSAYAMEQK